MKIKLFFFLFSVFFINVAVTNAQPYYAPNGWNGNVPNPPVYDSLPPNNYIGPTTQTECLGDLGGIVAFMQACKDVMPISIKNKFGNNISSICGSGETGSGANILELKHWDGPAWPTIATFFKEYYLWLWATAPKTAIVDSNKFPHFPQKIQKNKYVLKPDASISSNANWCVGPGCNPLTDKNVLQGPVSSKEACKMIFSKEVGEFSTSAILNESQCIIAVNSFCLALQNNCQLENLKWFGDNADVQTKCKHIFDTSNLQLQESRKAELLNPCYNAWLTSGKFKAGSPFGKDDPICKKLATDSPNYQLCECEGDVAKLQSFFVARGGKSSMKADNKASCCSICHTRDVQYEKKTENCSQSLTPPVELLPSCVCRLQLPLKQTFAFPKGTADATGQKECCSLCTLTYLKPKITSFNTVDFQCGFLGVGDITQNGIQKFQSPLRAGIVSPQTFIGNLIKVLLGIVGSLAFAMVVWGGFQWMTSAGSSERIKSGQQTVMWAVFGLVAIFISYGVVNVLLGLG